MIRVAIYSQRVRYVLERKKLLTVAPHTTVSKATKMMAKAKVSAVVVFDNEALVGIFTERDAVSRAIAQDLNVATTQLSEVMTPNPKTIAPEKTFGPITSGQG